MEIYLGLLVLVLGLCFFGALINSQKQIVGYNDKYAKAVLVLILVILTLFAGFRYNVGVDYPNYVYIYKGARWYGVNEPGFMWIIKALKLFGFKFQAMFLLLAIIMQILMYKIITNYSANYWLSILIYLSIAPFYLATFNGIRQFLAIALFISMIDFIVNKQFLKFLIIIIIGMFFFHMSLFLTIGLYFVLQIDFSLSRKILLLSLVIVGNIFMTLLISWSPYAHYLSFVKKTPISMGVMIFFVIALFVMFFEKKIPEFKNKKIFLSLNFLSFLTLLSVFLQDKGIIVQMFMRLNNYFFFIYILLIPAIIVNIKSRLVRLSSSTLLIIVLFMYYFRTIIAKGEEYRLIPYNVNFEIL